MALPKEEIIYCPHNPDFGINKKYCPGNYKECNNCPSSKPHNSKFLKRISCGFVDDKIWEDQCLAHDQPKENLPQGCQGCIDYKDHEKDEPRKLRIPSYKQKTGKFEFKGELINFTYWFLSTGQVRRLWGLPSRPTKEDHKLLSDKLGIALRKEHTECLIRATREYMELKKTLYLVSMPVKGCDNALEINVPPPYGGTAVITADRTGHLDPAGHPFTTSRVELKKIHKWAEEGIQLLEGINLYTLASLTPLIYHPDKPACLPLIDKTNYLLRWLRFFATTALERTPPPKKTAKIDVPFIFLISSLRETYEDATGKKAYGNIGRPFFKFVKSFLELIHESPDSEESLEGLIKRALKPGWSPSTHAWHMIDFPV